MLWSCSEEQLVTDQTVANTTSQSVEVTPEGFLSFSTFEDFEAYLNAAEQGQQPEIAVKSRGGKAFESIAMLQKKVKGATNSRAFDFDVTDAEDGSLDEYNLSKAEALIFDNLLFHAMDTTLRICVEGTMYKVTKNGTYSAHLTKADLLDSASRRVDTTLTLLVPPGGTIDLDSDIRYTNSFGDKNSQHTDILTRDNDGVCSLSNLVQNPNYFYSNYNVVNEKFNKLSGWAGFLEMLGNRDITRERNFDKNHRMSVNMFDVNYLFYKSVGMKVKFQVRKKWLGIPYWIESVPEDMVIGFDYLDGYLKYAEPQYIGQVMPPYVGKWPRFSATIENYTRNFCYGLMKNLPFIKDWAPEIYAWMPELSIGSSNMLAPLSKYYSAPVEQIYNMNYSLVGKTITYPNTRTIQKSDPILGYIINAYSPTHYTKERFCITGIKSFKEKYKSVIFDRCFGFTVINGVPLPTPPSDCQIKNLDAFGAVKYDGKWLGVRFYTE